MKTYENCAERAFCPICSAEDARLLWRVNSKQAAQHFVLYEKDPERFGDLVSHIEHLWGQNTCEIVQCDQCGFCYSHPYVAGDEGFYSLAFIRAGYPKWKWEFQVTYDVLRRDLGANAKLIEIGAGDGAFIWRIAKEMLPKENIFCTEFSEFGRDRIEEFGVNCASKDVRELSGVEFEGAADVICLFQVLEHMDRLDALFEKLCWLLKPRGSIFIAVPNRNRIEFNELNGALPDMPPNHIGRWNKQCFEVIGRRYNLAIADYKIEDADLTSIAKQFTIDRFLRNSQNSGGFSNKLQQVENRHLRRVAQVFGVAVNAISAIPAMRSFIAVRAGLGNSQWVHFVRN